MEKLIDAKIDKLYKIKGVFDGTPFKIKRRIFELGFTKGQSIKLLRKSMLKKAYLVEIRGIVLTLRKDIAQQIEIV